MEGFLIFDDYHEFQKNFRRNFRNEWEQTLYEFQFKYENYQWNIRRSYKEVTQLIIDVNSNLP